MTPLIRERLRAIARACSDPETVDALDRLLAGESEGKWVAGPPPKRGPWKVRCGGDSPNVGFRYWNGERWGVLCRTFKGAQFIKDTGRLRPLKQPVLWWSTEK